MLTGRRFKGVAALMALALLFSSACSQRDDDDDTTSGGGGVGRRRRSRRASTPRNCGQRPHRRRSRATRSSSCRATRSPATPASLAEVAAGWHSYFEKVNADGGVEVAGNSYQIEYEAKDDEYDPARRPTNITELVGADGLRRLRRVRGHRHGRQPRHPRAAQRPVRAAAARGVGLAGVGQPRLPVDGRRHQPRLHARGAGVRRPAEERPRRQDRHARAGRRLRPRLRRRASTQAIEGTDMEVVEIQRYAPGVSPTCRRR